MIQYILLGAGFAFAAVVQPGPLQAFLLSRAAAYGWKRTLPAALSPLLSDGPIALLVLLVLGCVPSAAQEGLRAIGGLLLLYFAWTTFRESRAGTEPSPGDTGAPRTFLQAALVNFLNPNPYLGWALVLGPAAAGAWRESRMSAVALIVAFYGVLVVGLAAFILLAGTARLLGPRRQRALILISALILAGLGVYQLLHAALVLGPMRPGRFAVGSCLAPAPPRAIVRGRRVEANAADVRGGDREYPSSRSGPSEMNKPDKEPDEPRSVTLLLHCPLRLGLAADLTRFIYSHEGRILYHDQHVDAGTQHYYTRLRWDVSGFSLAGPEMSGPLATLIGDGPETEWSLHFSDDVPRMAVLVSKDPSCLYDILARSHSGEWAVEVPVIVANHPDLEPVARRFGVEFRAFSVSKENKSNVEEEQLALLRSHRVDFVVLARYMQVLTGRFVQAYPNRIINIHHAFLPAFPGARPYHAARERGVKIIGATSHYVTETLDAGPIIEQDVRRVTHRHSVQDLIRMGRDLEKVVLSRAIWSHIRRKIIVHKGRTVVFD